MGVLEGEAVAAHQAYWRFVEGVKGRVLGALQWCWLVGWWAREWGSGVVTVHQRGRYDGSYKGIAADLVGIACAQL